MLLGLVVAAVLLPCSSLKLPTTPGWSTRRCGAALACVRPAPPAPPQTSRGYGGSDGGGGVGLRSITREERLALTSIWSWQYEGSATATSDLSETLFVAHWKGDLIKSGWLGMLHGRQLGAFVRVPSDSNPRGAYLPAHCHPRLACVQVGDQLDDLFAIVVIRYELDASHWRKLLVGRHLMVVDEIALSPSVPEHLRGLLHAALVQCLVQLGEVHGMSVAFIDDFDI